MTSVFYIYKILGKMGTHHIELKVVYTFFNKRTDTIPQRDVIRITAGIYLSEKL